MSPCWNWRKCPSLLTTRLHSAVYASAGEAATSYTSVSRCSNIYICTANMEQQRNRAKSSIHIQPSAVFLTLVHPLVCFPIVSHSISHVSASKNSAWVLTNGALGCRYLMTNFSFGRHTPGDICPFFFFLQHSRSTQHAKAMMKVRPLDKPSRQQPSINPNILPFFAFVFLVYKSILNNPKKKKKKREKFFHSEATENRCVFGNITDEWNETFTFFILI